MPREEIHLDITFEELCARIDAAADRESHDECHRDWDWRPISDEEMLERVRRIERETGQQLIFRRDEQR